MPPKTHEKELTQLEAALKQLEAEYNMYFAGRLPKPPWETRARVENQVKALDRGYLGNLGDRFRFQSIQARFSSFIDLWDRAMRAREEGRPGPFAQPKKPDAAEKEKPASDDRLVHVASFKDPIRELDKLSELYEKLAKARRQIGEEAPPFNKFAELVKTQVKKLRDSGSDEVAFRVAVKDGKVSFTARALKGPSDENG